MSESHIVSDPRIMMGKPVVVGTRITVELILDKLGAGETFEQLLEEHPRLTEDSIRAALAFAGEMPSGSLERARRPARSRPR